MAGSAVTTLEGLAKDGVLHVILTGRIDVARHRDTGEGWNVLHHIEAGEHDAFALQQRRDRCSNLAIIVVQFSGGSLTTDS